jgi:hypothetical protein
MNPSAFALVAVLGTPQQAPASVFHCYGAMTQIGVVARRDFPDERGFIVQEIYYANKLSTPTPSCGEDTLRVHSIRTYKRDNLGRSLIETQFRPDGRVEQLWRFEYVGSEQRPLRRTLLDPNGNRKYEVRSSAEREQTSLYFDERGRVVGILGTIPDDVDFAWGTAVDDWSCGIAIGRRDPDGRLPVNVHLRNDSADSFSAVFAPFSLETELRDDRGRIVPLQPDYAAKIGALPPSYGFGRYLLPHTAAFHHYPLEERYGRLAPGHYSLVARYRHPRTGAMLTSNTITFDVGGAR